jgi:endonuclease/exonuclease/phosphatase family metal-dependent hydrolase
LVETYPARRFRTAGALLGAAAALAALTVWAPPAPARAELSVMTWNVCTATNPVCGLYRADEHELARRIAERAVSGPIRPEVIFLQEFCTGAARAVELRLERATGRAWSMRWWALTSADGAPYPCRPDRRGRSRGAQSIAVAVAEPEHAVDFTVHPLPAPPWYVRRAAQCVTIRARRVHACGAHLSAGTRYDDRGPGAPYRTRQIARLLALAAKPGHHVVFGGDLNVAPPDAAPHRPGGDAVAPAYRDYAECDQAGPARTGRWTYHGDGIRAKLDYLFAARGRIRACHLPEADRLSDHRPLYMRVAL